MSLLQRGLSCSKTKCSGNMFKAAHPNRHLFTQSRPRSPIRTTLYAALFTVSAGAFAVYYFDSRSALHRYVVTPIIRNIFDAETGHKLAVKVLKYRLSPKDQVSDDARLKCKIWGDKVSNPIGIAAGFDKDGEAIDGLFDLGFSWVEIGSVTPKPQPGNAKPRVFRLEEDAGMINRYGFPSKGHSYVLSRIRERIPTFLGGLERASLREGDILAVNLGKNKESPTDSIDDFVTGVRMFGPYTDVLVVNVSSPNTPGLRGLQNRDQLERLLDGVTKARDELEPSLLTSQKPKLLVKLAPDLGEPELIDIANVIHKSKIDGVIVSNTTIQRPKHLLNSNKNESGGLSGAPVKQYSLKALGILRKHLPASIPLIGCGGITTGADALDFAKAGASLVQVYTSFGYDGVGACRRIKNELVNELAKEGKTWTEVVDEAVNQLSLKEPHAKEENKKDHRVSQLISEAEHLNDLLNLLGDRLDKGEDGNVDLDANIV